ncbi:hypothetical protein ABT009_16430 [Streptomyces sp. NPDC002896]|uniref:hypothetical protein n=1 Tax=Streptomyces sp. NPDC002896 TaxID=3154438 RepID=UPI0033184A16
MSVTAWRVTALPVAVSLVPVSLVLVFCDAAPPGTALSEAPPPGPAFPEPAAPRPACRGSAFASPAADLLPDVLDALFGGVLFAEPPAGLADVFFVSFAAAPAPEPAVASEIGSADRGAGGAGGAAGVSDSSDGLRDGGRVTGEASSEGIV